MTTQPTPQPAGDAVEPMLVEAVPATWKGQRYAYATGYNDALYRVRNGETARAIQAGKGEVVNDAIVKRAWAAYEKRTSELDESEQGSLLDRMHEGMRAALEAALAGSQGEGVGGGIKTRLLNVLKQLRDSGPTQATLMNVDRVIADAEATAPDPAAPDGDATADLIARLRLEAMMLIKCHGRVDQSSDVFVLREAADALAALSNPRVSESGDGWISVDDRLPSDDERVLVCANTGFGGSPQKGLSWFKRGTGKFDDDGVTHWQSFPPPPQRRYALHGAGARTRSSETPQSAG